jgi:hypothetical protein
MAQKAPDDFKKKEATIVIPAQEEAQKIRLLAHYEARCAT